MSKINDGGPAFPADIQRRDPVTTEWGDLPPQGMSMRDWFAGQALAGLCAGLCSAAGQKAMTNEMKRRGIPLNRAEWYVAKVAHDYADAMLAERKKANG